MEFRDGALADRRIGKSANCQIAGSLPSRRRLTRRVRVLSDHDRRPPSGRAARGDGEVSRPRTSRVRHSVVGRTPRTGTRTISTQTWEYSSRMSNPSSCAAHTRSSGTATRKRVDQRRRRRRRVSARRGKRGAELDTRTGPRCVRPSGGRGVAASSASTIPILTATFDSPSATRYGWSRRSSTTRPPIRVPSRPNLSTDINEPSRLVARIACRGSGTVSSKSFPTFSRSRRTHSLGTSPRGGTGRMGIVDGLSSFGSRGG